MDKADSVAVVADVEQEVNRHLLHVLQILFHKLCNHSMNESIWILETTYRPRFIQIECIFGI